MDKRKVKKWLAHDDSGIKETFYTRKPYTMVRLEYGKLEGVGFAKRNPTDEYNFLVGYYRARNRALDDLAGQLMGILPPEALHDRASSWRSRSWIPYAMSFGDDGMRCACVGVSLPAVGAEALPANPAYGALAEEGVLAE